MQIPIDANEEKNTTVYVIKHCICIMFTIKTMI